MRIFRISIWISILLQWSSSLSAQNEGTPSFIAEQMVVHTDRQLYASSETIWFKLYVFEATLTKRSTFSKVAYVELISGEGGAIAQAKILLKDGLGVGSFQLPNAIRSGSYELVAYTQGMRNRGGFTFARQPLFLLQPGQAVVRYEDKQEASQKVFQPLGNTINVSSNTLLDIDVRASSQRIGQRELVSLEIGATDRNGQPVVAEFSMSVAVKSPQASRLFRQGEVNDNQNATTRLLFQPEPIAMRLQGKVLNEQSGKGEPNIEVFLAFPGKRAIVFSTFTDEEGSFSYLLPELFGLKQVIVQLGQVDDLPLKIELEDAFHLASPAEGEIVVLPREWERFAETILENAQIEQAYQAFAQTPDYIVDTTFEWVPFFGQPDLQYKLDDFTRFPLPEFFYEVVPKVRVLGKFGEERLKVLNNRESVPDNILPLLLVDGVPVFDQRTFLKINNKLIESAEIVTEPFWLNPGIYQGIIQLNSFEGEARCFSLPETAIRRSFLAFLPERKFIAPDYEVLTDSTLPDFRNTLYWNPRIQTDALGKATVQFYTSDVLGEYEIRVEGVTKEGSVGYSSTVLEIGKENRER